ncbi:hypothetical protein M409DRAFT_23810 [Zasmidium cellare ATCC 36951]|uniref:Uncharacterized protein n=1 Tax=Zasmidium cellare ATCC 36951 TaxID=1080233 RepID=A0A6A6CJF0_ZASCE|nr:uncharacterized protein M409DRAFT_23810 [Zasmidium cellare ATCC 36951]KAF2166082.1 hypothetical protein M409DRAFT_23810 [Zasmidium cellare ATCC 36951]
MENAAGDETIANAAAALSSLKNSTTYSESTIGSMITIARRCYSTLKDKKRASRALLPLPYNTTKSDTHIDKDHSSLLPLLEQLALCADTFPRSWRTLPSLHSVLSRRHSNFNFNALPPLLQSETATSTKAKIPILEPDPTIKMSEYYGCFNEQELYGFDFNSTNDFFTPGPDASLNDLLYGDQSFTSDAEQYFTQEIEPVTTSVSEPAITPFDLGVIEEFNNSFGNDQLNTPAEQNQQVSASADVSGSDTVDTSTEQFSEHATTHTDAKDNGTDSAPAEVCQHVDTPVDANDIGKANSAAEHHEPASTLPATQTTAEVTSGDSLSQDASDDTQEVSAEQYQPVTAAPETSTADDDLFAQLMSGEHFPAEQYEPVFPSYAHAPVQASAAGQYADGSIIDMQQDFVEQFQPVLPAVAQPTYQQAHTSQHVYTNISAYNDISALNAINHMVDTRKQSMKPVYSMRNTSTNVGNQFLMLQALQQQQALQKQQQALQKQHALQKQQVQMQQAVKAQQAFQNQRYSLPAPAKATGHFTLPPFPAIKKRHSSNKVKTSFESPIILSPDAHNPPAAPFIKAEEQSPPPQQAPPARPQSYTNTPQPTAPAIPPLGANGLRFTSIAQAQEFATARTPLNLPSDDFAAMEANPHPYIHKIMSAFHGPLRSEPENYDVTRIRLEDWVQYQLRNAERAQKITRQDPSRLELAAWLIFAELIEAHKLGVKPTSTSTPPANIPKCSLHLEQVLRPIRDYAIFRFDLLRLTRVDELVSNVAAATQRKLSNFKGNGRKAGRDVENAKRAAEMGFDYEAVLGSKRKRGEGEGDTGMKRVKRVKKSVGGQGAGGGQMGVFAAGAAGAVGAQGGVVGDNLLPPVPAAAAGAQPLEYYGVAAAAAASNGGVGGGKKRKVASEIVTLD